MWHNKSRPFTDRFSGDVPKRLKGPHSKCGRRVTARESSNLSISASSSQASYRLRRVFYAPHQKLIVRSFCCSSFPNRIRFAGFRFGFGCGMVACTSKVFTLSTLSRTSYRSRRLFYLKVIAHSLRSSSFPNRTLFAGLRFGFTKP